MGSSDMMSRQIAGRNLKKKVLELIKGPDFGFSLEEIKRLPCRLVVNPLLSLMLDPDEQVRWRAVTALGAVVALIARDDMESARVIMRRLMWSLNDESGGIDWGAPEAMGEIMAQSERIADEYHAILISYLDENGNFLEYEPLQKGLLWGIARLSTVRPDLMEPTLTHLWKYLDSEDPSIRGLSAYTICYLTAGSQADQVKKLFDDHAEFQTFWKSELRKFKVSEFIKNAVSSQ
ncbi:MAG: DVU0298 family protein [Desulfomonilaceae bacterium]